MAGDGATQDVKRARGGGAVVRGVAARGGRDVLVLEKVSRTAQGPASGGSCNPTTTLGPMRPPFFGARGERFPRGLPGPATRGGAGTLRGRGVATEEAPLEKVFPASGNARDVRDALEGAARGAGARIQLDAGAVAVERDGDLGPCAPRTGGPCGRGRWSSPWGMSCPEPGPPGTATRGWRRSGWRWSPPFPRPSRSARSLPGSTSSRGSRGRARRSGSRTRRVGPSSGECDPSSSPPGPLRARGHGRVPSRGPPRGGGAPTGSGGGAPAAGAAPTLRVDFFPDPTGRPPR